MTHKTPQDAEALWYCPLKGQRCIADDCPMWRWQQRIEITTKAEKEVWIEPRTGYCGMAGKP